MRSTIHARVPWGFDALSNAPWHAHEEEMIT